MQQHYTLRVHSRLSLDLQEIDRLAHSVRTHTSFYCENELLEPTVTHDDFDNSTLLTWYHLPLSEQYIPLLIESIEIDHPMCQATVTTSHIVSASSSK